MVFLNVILSYYLRAVDNLPPLKLASSCLITHV
jgi:hypothetical protein